MSIATMTEPELIEYRKERRDERNYMPTADRDGQRDRDIQAKIEEAENRLAGLAKQRADEIEAR